MIKFWLGKNGSGKTYDMTKCAYKEWKKGARIFSNYPLFFSEKNERIYYFNDLSEIIYFKNGIILIDDATGILDARNWQNLPHDFAYKLTLHRHDKLDLYATTQDFSFIDKRARKLAESIIFCKKVLRFPFNPRANTKFQISTKTKCALVSEEGKDKLYFNSWRPFIIHSKQNPLYDCYQQFNLNHNSTICVLENKKTTVKLFRS